MTTDAGKDQLRLSGAFIGKGGVGKSVVAGTLCRHLARHGRSVGEGIVVNLGHRSAPHRSG